MALAEAVAASAPLATTACGETSHPMGQVADCQLRRDELSRSLDVPVEIASDVELDAMP
jgi:hypothetical protein